MILTDEEKLIIKEIASNQIYDAFSFLMRRHSDCFKAFDTQPDPSFKGGILFSYPEVDMTDPENINDLQRFMCPYIAEAKLRLFEFISLISILEENHLIVRVQDFGTREISTYFFNEPERVTGKAYDNAYLQSLEEGYKTVSDLFINRYDLNVITLKNLRVVPTNALKEFIKTWKTRDELYNEEALKSAKFSSRLAIGIAVFTTAVSILFNIINIRTTKVNRILDVRDQTDYLVEQTKEFDRLNASADERHHELLNKLNNLDIEITLPTQE